MSNGDSIGEAFGHKNDRRRYKPSCLLNFNYKTGLEIEAEGVNRAYLADTPLSSFWIHKEDGTLRPGPGDTVGREFIFDQPLFGEDIILALQELKAYLNYDKNKINFSERCSTHVHIDVSSLNYAQFHNVLLFYIIFERLLFNFVEESRKHSSFCIPFYRAEGGYFLKCKKQIRSDDYLVMQETLSTGSYRYSALNLASLNKFGTLEFRHKEGTLDIEDLVKWLNILYSLIETGTRYSLNKKIDVRDLVTIFNDRVRLATNIFGLNSLSEKEHLDIAKGCVLAFRFIEFPLECVIDNIMPTEKIKKFIDLYKIQLNSTGRAKEVISTSPIAGSYAKPPTTVLTTSFTNSYFVGSLSSTTGDIE